MDRRNFIRKSSLATAGIASSLHMQAFQSNEKLKVGLIGCGWYGMVITTAALRTENVEVTAVCDIDSAHLKNSADEIAKIQGTRPKELEEYQELLDVPGLDAVFIGTPPHWHALQFIAACEKGLDIYCEKPLSYDVREGQAMIKAAQKAGNIVQIGFQRRQSKAFQKAKQLIAEGKLGEVHEIGAQIHYNPSVPDTTIQAPPSSLDWEAWCGPAPKLDYRPSIGHKAWRLEKAYGNGHLVDWGIHHIDIIRTIMDFDMPLAFNTKGSLDILKDKITTPDTLHATMEFAQCPVRWQHRLWGSGDLSKELNNGIFFYGEAGTLFASDERLIFTPTGRGEQEIMDISTPEMQDNHLANFVNAVLNKDKNRLACTIDDAFQSTATVQLAMASYYTDAPVHWDFAKKEIIGNPDAAKLLARNYRGDYKRPEV